MKFTKDEALEKLKGILTVDGKKPLRMSEKSLERQLETLMPLVADDEMELDAFVEKVKVSFETMNSNAEKDNADFVRKWNEEHKPDKGGNGEDDEGRSPDIPEEFLNRLKSLEEKELAREAEREQSRLRRELKKTLKEKGVSDDEWCDLMIGETSLDKDTDISAKAESLLKIYNRQESIINTDVTPRGASRSGKALEESFAKIAKRRNERLGYDDEGKN